MEYFDVPIITESCAGKVGEMTLSWETGEIQRADPKAWLHCRFLDARLSSTMAAYLRDIEPPFELDLTLSKDTLPGCAIVMHWEEALGWSLILQSVKRKVVYRITDYCPEVDAYLMEWPD